MDRDDSNTTPVTLSEGARQRIGALVDRYPTRLSALLPSLWVVQDELGWVPPFAVDELIEIIEVPRSRVHEVLTFYPLLRTEPPARHTLRFCQNICCHILGAREMVAHVQKRLGVRLGQTTPDGIFALEGVGCLGACGHGPVMQLGKHYYEYLTAEKVDSILESLRKGVVPRADTDRELEGEA